jgi:hypothetical protein
MAVDVDQTPLDGKRLVGPAVLGVVSGDDVDVRQSGVGAVFAKHDISFSGGASCFPVVAGSAVRFEQGGACGAIAGHEVTVGRGGFLGFAFAPKVVVDDGGRVLMTTKQAAVFGLTVAAGLLFALVCRPAALARRSR